MLAGATCLGSKRNFLLSKQNLYPHKDRKMFLHGANMPTGMVMSRMCLSRSKFLWDDVAGLINLSEVWLSEFFPSKTNLTSFHLHSVY